MAFHGGHLSRRESLALLGGGIVLLGTGSARAQAVTVRQGYQTSIWGMPTYYLLQSGLLAKEGIVAEEFAVPSGSMTMQQMVARQVDLGTFAGQSFLLGADKGDLVAIAQIQEVGRTMRVMARKDLGITKVEQLRGLKVANQVGSSMGTIWADKFAPKHGLKKGDFQEIRMNVNDMVAALAAKTIDAMVNVEPYNAIAEADGIATSIANLSAVDQLPVLMAATPDFLDKHPDAAVKYLRAWLQVDQDFKQKPAEVSDVIYGFYADKGYGITREVFRNAMSTIDVAIGFPDTLKPYMEAEAKILIDIKRIKDVPDWSKVLRPDLLEKARGKAA